METGQQLKMQWVKTLRKKKMSKKRNGIGSDGYLLSLYSSQ
jgi:hypothetical protein